MSISPVERSAGSMTPVERTPLTAMDILSSAVLWLDAALSTITDDEGGEGPV